MATLTIKKEDVDFASNYLVQYLRDTGFEGDLSNGSALYDLLIKPYALLYTLFKKDINRTLAYFSLADAQRLKSELGEEYDTAVDSILSNWFMYRRPGKPSKGKVRLYFSAVPTYFQIAKNEEVFSSNNIYFLSDNLILPSENDYNVIVSIDGVKYYYLDIPVTSVINTNYIPKVGELVKLEVKNTYLVKGVIEEEFVAGEVKESSESFIERSKFAITTRELITERAIDVVLRERFGEIKDIYVAGYGAPEMLRDINVFGEVEIHVGNHCDIYVKTPLKRESIKFTVPEDYKINFNDKNIIDIIQIIKFNTSNNTNTQIPYTFENFNSLTYSSGYIDTKIVLNSNNVSVGDEIIVDVIKSDLLSDISNYVNLQRIVSYSPLVKHKFPVVLSLNIPLKVKSQLSNEELLVLKNKIIQYINNLDIKEFVSVSKIISFIVSNNSKILDVVAPFNIGYSMLNVKTGGRISNTFNGVFSLPLGISSQQTNNTTIFYTDNNLITFTVAVQ